jgi:hypothetical protein
VDASADQIVAELCEDVGPHGAIGIDGRDEIREDAVKIGHVSCESRKLASA